MTSISNQVSARTVPLPLMQPFAMITFDWDGTAVMHRSDNAGAVRALLERLLRMGVFIVIVTGTNFPNIDHQLAAAIRGPHKRRLFISANRGSEVYGFDAASAPILVWQRVATPEEDRRLTEIANAVRETLVARTDLEIRVIYNRLNRRKIDLIPLPAWSDPPKSALGLLLQAVNERLRGAGLSDGLRAVMALTEQTARERGLPEARITTDVKHVEVGLTDKADAVAWMMREVAHTEGIPPGQVLIVGDEFGPIDGFAGSDDKMVTPAAQGVVFVSVGPEPGGVPPEVIHLGGGPDRFQELLAQQVAMHAQRARPATAAALDLPTIPATDRDWLFVEEGFALAREHEIESLFAVANGYVGVRGALAEGSSLSLPATYVAGVFDVGTGAGSIPALVVLPDWAQVRVVVDGHTLHLEAGEILEHRRVLDLRRGIFWREWRQRDPTGRVTHVRYLRLASLSDRHALLQSLTVTPENYRGRLRLESAIERATGDAERAMSKPYAPIPVPDTPAPPSNGSPASVTGPLILHATSTGVTVAVALASAVRREGGGVIMRAAEDDAGRRVEGWEWEEEIGQVSRLDRLVAVHTSRDTEQPAAAAAAHLQRMLHDGVDAIRDAHVRAWESRWQIADIVAEGDEETTRALRFGIYHLIGAANPADERVSIGARALTGDAYKGHVFWDTEIFMLPFYTFTDPAAACALLMYRYHTLPAARAKAHGLGYRGALYAWESTDTGEETTPSEVTAPNGEMVRILTGEQEHHISADVAYAIWQYWQASGDDTFFVETGAEIVLETARFWASRGTIGPDGRYHIRTVIGPDEYHEGVDDNAYTNGMAQWNLERGAETACTLAERWPARWQALAERLTITAQESQEWARLAAAMYTGFDPHTGLFEQFSGYFGLEDIDLTTYTGRTVPMDVLLGRERTQRSQVVKQADVVLLLHLLWDRFPPQVREENFRYYEPRTGHGSSLSPGIHALVAARLGNLPLAERYLRQAIDIDLANNMGNAAGGVHAAALGGLWQVVVFGFAGMRLQGDGLAFDPHLPQGWRSLRFAVRWRGSTLRVMVRQEPTAIEVRLEGVDMLQVAVAAEAPTVLRPGCRYTVTRAHEQWEQWREVPG